MLQLCPFRCRNTPTVKDYPQSAPLSGKLMLTEITTTTFAQQFFVAFFWARTDDKRATWVPAQRAPFMGGGVSGKGAVLAAPKEPKGGAICKRSSLGLPSIFNFSPNEPPKVVTDSVLGRGGGGGQRSSPGPGDPCSSC